MKTSIITLLLLVFVTASCQSENNNPADAEFVRAKIDGMDWEATSFQSSHINNIISIESAITGDSSIEISVQNVKNAATYSLGNVSIAVYEIGLDNFTESYATSGTLGNGTINISVLTSSRIEGTFSFTGGNGLGGSKTISGGSFKINLTN